MSRLNSFLLFLSIFSLVYGHKILVYSPKLGKSHVMLLGKVADILAQAGHEIVLYQPNIDENITTTGTKFARVIERPLDFHIDFNFDEMQDDVWDLGAQSFSKMATLTSRLRQIQQTNCKNQIADGKIMDQLKSENFTMAIGESFDACYYGVLEILGIDKYITVFSGSGFTTIFGGMIGIPSTPSFLPGMLAGMPPFSYVDRAKNLFTTVLMNWYFTKNFVDPLNEILRPVLGEKFVIRDKFAESSLIFVNADEHLEYPQPISHKYVNIGGLGQAQPKPLDKKYEEIMSSSKRGVILVSFGSVAQCYKMPDLLKKKFLDTFAQFPDITFLWKYEKDEDNIAQGYANVITGKWLPQTDLLAHPKVLAFISHGGANSLIEASYAGVPLIGIPLMADQFRNAQMAQYRKIAIIVHKAEILEGKLAEAIKKIVNDESYQYHAKRLSKMIKTKPMSADERIIKYTEFAAEFGKNNNLDMEGRHLNFVQFYCLDIILPVIGLILFILYILYRFVKFLLRKSFFIFSGKSKIE